MPPANRNGFTLVEVLVATAITLVLMGAVASIFALVTTGVSDSRAAIEMNDRLRFVKDMLQTDLMGVTAPTIPPLRPEDDLGYFELIEGPIGPIFLTTEPNPESGAKAVTGFSALPYNGTNVYFPVDETFDDMDDILMFTSNAINGQYNGNWSVSTSVTAASQTTQTSPNAEIAWFCRGTNLYRRQLLVVPGMGISEMSDFASATYTLASRTVSFYCSYDCSMRCEGGSADPQFFGPGVGVVSGAGPTTNPSSMQGIIKSCSLGDLTKRENRYAHQPLVYPHDARVWSYTTYSANYAPQPGLGLPTLFETSDRYWPFPLYDWNNTTKVNTQTIFSSMIPKTPPATGSTNVRPFIFPQVAPSGSNSSHIPFNNQPPPSITSNLAAYAPNGYALALTASTYFMPVGGVDRQGGLTTGTVSAMQSGVFSWSLNVPTLVNFASGTSRFDDVMLQNVIAFDAKVWDPGAPIFEVGPSTLANTTNTQSTSLAPGDAGYGHALHYFLGNPTTVAQTSANIRGVTFGAYADLNYMYTATPALDSYNPAFRTLTSSFAPNTTAATTANFPITAGSNNYEAKLQAYEKLAINSTTGGSKTASGLPRPHFAGPGDPRSGLFGCWMGNNTAFGVPAVAWVNGAPTITGFCVGAGKVGQAATVAAESWADSRPLASVYDTWSTHYERDGIANNIDSYFNRFYGIEDPLVNGLDDDGINGLDDPGEVEAPPPYPHPLRAIQVRIRVFEPDTKQIREVSLIHEFLPE
jgi:prepilin-type N-terminal cleavage/methylation domain-containing protein